MHPDDLNIVWLCRECGRGFAFNSDVEDHKRLFGHSEMILRHLQADIGKALPQFTRGRISLDFRLEGKVSRVIVEYEYYPSDGTLQYIDVKYSDKTLRSMVEGDPGMMKNIDNYLRRLLMQNQSARL